MVNSTSLMVKFGEQYITDGETGKINNSNFFISYAVFKNLVFQKSCKVIYFNKYFPGITIFGKSRTLILAGFPNKETKSAAKGLKSLVFF